MLVLERGASVTHQQLGASPNQLLQAGAASFVNHSPDKPWVFSVGLGGGSNCWWACTPRMLPEDFELRTKYGIGRDWPLDYEELDPYYCTAEEILGVSGSDEPTLFPRSRPLPMPPHRLASSDRILAAAHPGLVVPQPTARPSRSTSNRPACCNNGVCQRCPIDSKFTVQNELGWLFRDSRVRIETEAKVEHVITRNDVALGVSYRREESDHRAEADLIGLGAGGIHNPYLLLRSGVDDAWVGRRLHEQVSFEIAIDLDGVDNFDGGTSVTALGYMAYHGPHRRKRAAALIEFLNLPKLRMERGKWRHYLRAKAIFEDLPTAGSRVSYDPENPNSPHVTWDGISAYARAGRAALDEILPTALSGLPIEDMRIAPEPTDTECHVLGTTVMGTDPSNSVIDRDLLHHRLRNLLVLGGGAFPTSAPANPTLTLCALSVRAAAKLHGSAVSP